MVSYRDAGVDLDQADRHTAGISELVTNTWDESVVGRFGGFAAGVAVPDGYREPVLMMSTDGVGTKLEIARMSGRWAGVGFDLVAMCVDDLAAVGARPIGFVDYLAVGKLDVEREKAIVRSVAEACESAGVPLIGGETAEHPDVMGPDSVDLAGTAAGVVEKGQDLRPDRVKAGDVLIGLRSPNLRSNGFSLIRALFGSSVTEYAATLLEPSVIYSPEVLAAVATGGVRSAAHITGGGLVANVARALPRDIGATIDTGSWELPAVFEMISERGVDRDEMLRTFNMGIGFALVVDPERTDDVALATSGHQPVIIGEVSGETGVLVN